MAALNPICILFEEGLLRTLDVQFYDQRFRVFRQFEQLAHGAASYFAPLILLSKSDAVGHSAWPRILNHQTAGVRPDTTSYRLNTIAVRCDIPAKNGEIFLVWFKHQYLCLWK